MQNFKNKIELAESKMWQYGLKYLDDCQKFDKDQFDFWCQSLDFWQEQAKRAKRQIPVIQEPPIYNPENHENNSWFLDN